jgi:DNA-directed RNA polymerase specialized sigma24 family protein
MDAVQNAALRLYSMDESLFPADHELAWLHTVVKNEALMILRKKKPEDSVEELPEIPVSEQQLELLEDVQSVQLLLATLDPKRQNVVA